MHCDKMSSIGVKSRYLAFESRQVTEKLPKLPILCFVANYITGLLQAIMKVYAFIRSNDPTCLCLPTCEDMPNERPV